MAIHSALTARALETLFSGILITAAKEGECSKASALHPTRTFVNCSFRVTLQGQLTVDLILALNFWLTKAYTIGLIAELNKINVPVAIYDISLLV